MYIQIFNWNYFLVVLFLLIVNVRLASKLSVLPGFDKMRKWVLSILILCVCYSLADVCRNFFGINGRTQQLYGINAVTDLIFALTGFLIFFYSERKFCSRIFQKWYGRIIFMLPMIGMVILQILSWKTRPIIYSTEYGGYIRGPLFVFYYFVLENGYVELALLHGIYRLCTGHRLNDRKQNLNTIGYVSCILSGIYLQLFFRDIPCANMGLTLAIVLIFVDCQENLLNSSREQLQETLQEVTVSNEIINAISKIYTLIYRIDLPDNFMEEVSNEDEIHRLSGNAGKATEILEDGILRLVDADSKATMVEFLNLSTLPERMQTEENIRMEYRGTDGNWYSSRFIVKKRDAAGTVTNVLYVVSPITAQKQREMEYQRQLYKSMEEEKRASQAKTSFLRRMSHDIRTPINGILGMANIGKLNLEDPKRQEQCLDKIIQSSNFLLDLVNEVLDMNKLESGEIHLEHVSFDLRSILRGAMTAVEAQALESGIRFEEKDYDVTHWQLIGSPLHLRQIVQNIMSNAIKYNREKGTIRVSCREISSDEDYATIEMVCSDTGIGMSKEFQEHVFEPFSQELDSARTNYSGTGLGLSIVKELVERMGGTIQFTSEKDVGTTFVIRITLEIDHSAIVEKQEEEWEQNSLSGVQILLVEDNELNMEIAEYLLKEEGAVVTKAWNGQEAVDLFAQSKQGQYDVILMDIMMPVLDGLEAAREIRAMERTDAGKIPIIAMTANAYLDDVARSKAAGMNEHISKPLNIKNLIQAIKKHL